MILILVSAALAIICTLCGEDTIPQLPELPEFGKNETDAIAELPNVGPTVLQNFKSAWTRLRGRTKAVNEEITKIFPHLKDAGEDGKRVLDGLTDLFGNLTATNPDDPLAVPKNAKAGYKVAEDLENYLSEAHPKIDGLDKFQTTLVAIKEDLGELRCPVAVLECMAADVADILGLTND